MTRIFNRAAFGCLLIVLNAGCATTAPPPRPVYVHVPCSTPGARPELPVMMDDTSRRSDQGQAVATPSAKPNPTVRCVIESR